MVESYAFAKREVTRKPGAHTKIAVHTGSRSGYINDDGAQTTAKTRERFNLPPGKAIIRYRWKSFRDGTRSSDFLFGVPPRETMEIRTLLGESRPTRAKSIRYRFIRANHVLRSRAAFESQLRSQQLNLPTETFVWLAVRSANNECAGEADVKRNAGIWQRRLCTYHGIEAVHVHLRPDNLCDIWQLFPCSCDEVPSIITSSQLARTP